MVLGTHRMFRGIRLFEIKDHSVLGCMNDMAVLRYVAAADAENLALMDVASLNHPLHRNISSARNYDRSIDLVISRTA